jgi:hypothetical protein
MSNRFVVALHEEGWKIRYRGLWSAGYAERGTALGVAVKLASAMPDLDVEVVLEEADGSQVLFWKSGPNNSLPQRP